jgi:hypothetical protein
MVAPAHVPSARTPAWLLGVFACGALFLLLLVVGGIASVVSPPKKAAEAVNATIPSTTPTTAPPTTTPPPSTTPAPTANPPTTPPSPPSADAPAATPDASPILAAMNPRFNWVTGPKADDKRDDDRAWSQSTASFVFLDDQIAVTVYVMPADARKAYNEHLQERDLSAPDFADGGCGIVEWSLYSLHGSTSRAALNEQVLIVGDEVTKQLGEKCGA